MSFSYQKKMPSTIHSMNITKYSPSSALMKELNKLMETLSSRASLIHGHIQASIRCGPKHMSTSRLNHRGSLCARPSLHGANPVPIRLLLRKSMLEIRRFQSPVHSSFQA